jgi:hypothetical protein
VSELKKRDEEKEKEKGVGKSSVNILSGEKRKADRLVYLFNQSFFQQQGHQKRQHCYPTGSTRHATYLEWAPDKIFTEDLPTPPPHKYKT